MGSPIAKEKETREEQDAVDEESGDSIDGDEDEGDIAEPPDTPTPMTRAQKRQAYIPLRASVPATQRITPAPPAPVLHPLQTEHNQRHSPKSSQNSPVSPTHAVARKSLPQTKRISVSGASHATFLSTASKNSIFSTPGRDEMERKKALVEVDEGPFARVQSMMDLDAERRRISSGGKKERDGDDGNVHRTCSFCRCAVM